MAGEVSFAGVPNNFSFVNAGNNTQQPQAPQDPGNVPPTPSKIYPGLPSTGGADPLVDNPQGNGTSNKGPSPIDKYKELLQTKPVDPNNKPAPSILDATSGEFLKVAEKMDFTSGITQEQLAALTAGGEGAVTALGEVLNTIGRRVYAEAGATASGIAKKSLTMAQQDTGMTVNQSIIQHGALTLIQESNPNMLNVAYKDLVLGIQKKMLADNPNLTSKELADNTVEYFQLATNTGKPQSTATQEENDRGLNDFFNW